MNCDQVFDILTRGPFPTGQECDQWVEKHLSRCRDCRRLAEALQPALELFEESVTPEEGRNLPAYWGALLDGAGEETLATTYRAGRSRKRVVALSPPQSRRRGWVAVGRLAAAVVVGVLLGAALGQIEVIDHKPPTPLAELAAASGDLKIDSTPTLAAVAGLDFLGLTPACLTSTRSESSGQRLHPTGDVAAAAARIQLADLACCTECHRSGGGGIASRPAVAKITMSCHLCHRP